MFFFLILFELPLLVRSIECYSCENSILLNTSVTSQNVPSFSQCQLKNGSQCMIYIYWDLNKNTSSIAINSIDLQTKNDISEDTLSAMIFLNSNHNENDFLSGHSLLYFCMSSDKCNSEIYLKKILKSLIMKENFREEFSSLLEIVPSFDPKTTQCFDLNNSTNECSKKDVNHCPRCQTIFQQTNSSSTEICATCPIDPINANTVSRSTTFVLTSQQQINQYLRLDCQIKLCNSLTNINKIYNSSIIHFDFQLFNQN